MDIAVGLRTSSRSGSPSISQIFAIQGPTATTTCSTAMSPAVVCTRVTAPELSNSKPVTSTPVEDVGARGARLVGEAEHRLAC